VLLKVLFGLKSSFRNKKKELSLEMNYVTKKRCQTIHRAGWTQRPRNDGAGKITSLIYFFVFWTATTGVKSVKVINSILAVKSVHGKIGLQNQ